MNTGFVKYEKLKKVYKNIRDSNGNPIPVLDSNGNEIFKNNSPQDADYIAPFFDNSLCPNGQTTLKQTTIYQTTNNQTTSNQTTSNQTTLNQTTTNCIISISSVSVDYSNSNYNSLYINTYSYNFGSIIDIKVTQNNTLISTSIDVIYLTGNSIWINIPKDIYGLLNIEIGKGSCKTNYNYYVQQQVTTLNQITTLQTTLNQTTSNRFLVNVKNQNCNYITTTINGCNLSSITLSQQLPNQFKVTYSGFQIANFKWIIKNSSGTQVQNGVVSSWTGNIFYINTSPALFDGLYTFEITATNISNGLDCNTVSSELQVTGNPYCNILINSISQVTLSYFNYDITSTITSGVINFEIINSLNQIVYSSTISAINQTDAFIYPLGTLNQNEVYTLKASKNAQCYSTLMFTTPVVTTSVPCNFDITNNTVIKNGSLYDFDFNVTNGQIDYQVNIYEGTILIIGFQVSEINSHVLFSVPESFDGHNISGKSLKFVFTSINDNACKKETFISIPI